MTPIPTFRRWTDQARESGKEIFHFQRQPEENFNIDVNQLIERVHAVGARMLVLCNPNNPTGALMPKDDVVRLMDELVDLDLIVIDESFLDFAYEYEIPTVSQEAALRKNVIVLKSLGKNFGLHGVRLGYAVTNPEMTAQLQQALPQSILMRTAFLSRPHEVESKHNIWWMGQDTTRCWRGSMICATHLPK